jgi:hypothetical protein
MINNGSSFDPAPSPPHGIAVSGLIFSALYFVSLVIVRLAVPADPADAGNWLVS